MLKIFKLKTTVETRFVYLYDLLCSVYKRWDTLSVALDTARKHRGYGGDAVPKLNAWQKKPVGQLKSILGVVRASMTALSGSKTVSFTKSITEWHKIMDALRPADDDEPIIARYKVELKAALDRVRGSCRVLCTLTN